MAKKAQRTNAPAENSPEVGGNAEVPAQDLSARTRRAIEAIRAPFQGFVSDFTSLTVKRGELAPKFMKAFNTWASETGRTFVDFVRVLDESVPVDRDHYRRHKSYQAADYLRRLVAQSGTRPAGAAARDKAGMRGAPAPTPPAEALARVLASVQGLMRKESVPDLWRALAQGFGWTDQQVTRLQNQVETAEPVLEIRAPRGHADVVGDMTVRPVEHDAQQAA
jgi:hypothetical protein